MNSMSKQRRFLAILGSLFLSSLSITSGQTLSSIDFTPLEGTAWGDSTVRLNIGNGLGMGTVTFSSINGGAFANAATPFAYNAPPYSSYNGPTTLGSGALFSPAFESVFTILPSSNAGLSGFSMTITLDTGAFTYGSVFSARSLGRNDTLGRYQYVSPVSGLGVADTAQLPTDGGSSADWALLDSGLNLYGAASNTAASKGFALPISGNSFTVEFLTTTNYQPGGVAFTVATAPALPVPEPSSFILVGIASAFCLRRSRRA